MGRLIALDRFNPKGFDATASRKETSRGQVIGPQFAPDAGKAPRPGSYILRSFVRRHTPDLAPPKGGESNG